jgi:hypothetical protein
MLRFVNERIKYDKFFLNIATTNVPPPPPLPSQSMTSLSPKSSLQRVMDEPDKMMKKRNAPPTIGLKNKRRRRLERLEAFDEESYHTRNSVRQLTDLTKEDDEDIEQHQHQHHQPFKIVKSSIYTMKYEELQRDEKGTMEKLYNWLGLHYVPNNIKPLNVK